MMFQRYTEGQCIIFDLEAFYKKSRIDPTTPFCTLLENRFQQLAQIEHMLPAERVKKLSLNEYVCSHGDCMTTFKYDGGVVCQGCLMVRYCSRDCRSLDLKWHRDKVCVGSFDLSVRQTVAAIIDDVDDWHARREADSDKAAVVRSKSITWRVPMPFIFNASALDPSTAFAAAGRRTPNGCMTLAVMILRDAFACALANREEDKGVALKQLLYDNHVRCNVCLKATGCKADLFMGATTKREGKEDMRFLFAGYLFGIDGTGACNGWLWCACSDECMSMCQSPLISRIAFSLWPSHDSGRVNLITNVKLGMGFFCA